MKSNKKSLNVKNKKCRVCFDQIEKKKTRNVRVDKSICQNEEENTFQDQIEGRNSVLELLKAGKDINKIFIERGEKQRFYQRNYSKSQTSASCDGGS